MMIWAVQVESRLSGRVGIRIQMKAVSGGVKSYDFSCSRVVKTVSGVVRITLSS